MPHPQLVITEHALQRAAERQITDTEIIEALAHGVKIKSYRHPGTWTATSSLITVAYRIVGRTVELLTVYREHDHG